MVGWASANTAVAVSGRRVPAGGPSSGAPAQSRHRLGARAPEPRQPLAALVRPKRLAAASFASCLPAIQCSGRAPDRARTARRHSPRTRGAIDGCRAHLHPASLRNRCRTADARMAGQHFVEALRRSQGTWFRTKDGTHIWSGRPARLPAGRQQLMPSPARTFGGSWRATSIGPGGPRALTVLRPYEGAHQATASSSKTSMGSRSAPIRWPIAGGASTGGAANDPAP
jgi:hypothetical protein